MKRIVFSIVLLVFVAHSCIAAIVVKSSESEIDRRFEKDMVYILTTCYKDGIRGVGLAGNLPDTLARTLSTQYLIPVVLIDSTLGNSTITVGPPVQFHQGLQVFVVEASSFDELWYTIHPHMRSTIWWNNMASFFIMDRSPKCSKSVDFLHIAWVRNILNAKVICYHLNRNKMIIFNFNPYTTEAPAPWKLINVFRGANHHPFAVFIPGYTKNESICDNLDFDKTRNLGGYEVSIEGSPLNGSRHSVHSQTTRHTYRYWITRDRIFHDILRTLNATPKFTPVKEMQHGTSADMRKIGRLMSYVWNNVKITYPHKRVGFILISQFRGHKSQLEKILCVIDVYSRYGMGIVYLITLIFLKFFVGQALIPALLNLVRITCDTGFENLPNTNAPRIFLTCLLFFVVTMQGIYQGNLAALLTTNIPLRNIEGIKDIVDLDYKLYGNDFIKNIVNQYPELNGRFRQIDGYTTDCIADVMNDSSAACVAAAEGWIFDLVEEHELHTSSEYIVTYYSAFEIRWDWPPEERVNIILSSLVETDVLLPWFIKCSPVELTDYKYDKEVKKNKDFKMIELHELTFAFVILAIGLICATVVFIIEVAIARV